MFRASLVMDDKEEKRDVENASDAVEWAIGKGFDVHRAEKMFYVSKGEFVQYGMNDYYLCLEKLDNDHKE